MTPGLLADSENVIVYFLLLVAFVFAGFGLAIALDRPGTKLGRWLASLAMLFTFVGIAIAGPDQDQPDQLVKGKYTLIASPVVFICYCLLYGAILKSQGVRIGRDRFWAKVFVSGFIGTLFFIVTKESLARTYDIALLAGSVASAVGGYVMLKHAGKYVGLDLPTADEPEEKS